MKRPHLLLCIAILLGLVATALGIALYSAHVTAGGGLLSAVCSEEGSGCANALASRWAYFPPSETRSEGAVPSALLGLIYAGGVTLWLIFIGLPGEQRRKTFSALFAVVALGCISSAAFIVIMAVDIEGWCPFCLGFHVANFALGVVIFLLRGPACEAQGIDPVHPRPRLVGATLALIAASGAAAWGVGQAALTEATFTDRFGSLDEAAGLLEAKYFATDKFSKDREAQARFDRILRTDDPAIDATTGARMSLVVFGDVECPNCYQFDLFLKEQLLPLFNGHLRVVYKHFPLKSKHKNAERAAWALEAARLQDKFWEAHAILTERRKHLAEVNYADFARELGLDAQRFLTDMESPEVKARVEEDLQFGKAVGVTGTPAVFLNRRLVDRSYRGLMGFWKLRAEALERARTGRDEEW